MRNVNCLAKAIHEISKLPGIGTRSAERLALHLLERPKKETEQLCQSLIELKEKSRLCSICFNLTEEELCWVCQEPNREFHSICVIEHFKDILSIENTGAYQGMYHVLMGHISPIEGKGPGDIKIQELIARIERSFKNHEGNKLASEEKNKGKNEGQDNEGQDGENGRIQEVILACNPNLEGDATALYIAELLKKHPIQVTRIARGLPASGDLDLADPLSLSRSLKNRMTMEEFL